MKADKNSVTRLLKTAKGQIEGVLNMIEDDRYCIDVCNQLFAVQSLIKKANKEILQSHMNSCVREAFENGNGEERINEILTILDKISK